MPYDKWSEVNATIKAIEPRVTLGQANIISEWADAMEKEGKVDSPWAVALSQFKKLYKVQDGKWVEREPAGQQEKVTCECLECGHVMEVEGHCADVECPKCGGEMRRLERPGPGRPSALQFTSNQTASVRTETIGGVEFLIAPVVAIRAGVLNGELVPAEEINHHVAAWNGRPFTVGHPQDADGEDVSANDPDRLAELQAGQLFNVRFEDGAIKGEVWVDLAKAKLVDGGPEVVTRLKSGKALEVSTAYLRDREEDPGTLDGVEYEAVARNLRPDHLAALLDAEGACSWEDGCGAPRINEEDSMDATVMKRITSALQTIASAVGIELNQTEEVSEMEELIKAILEDGRLGLNEEQLQALDEDVVKALLAALKALPKAEAEPEGNEEPEPDEDEDEEEEEEEEKPKAGEKDTVAELAEAIEKRGGLDAVLKAFDEIKGNQDERKAELMKALAANEANALTKEQLAALDVDTLEALQRSLSPADYSGQGFGPVSTSGITPYEMPDIFAQEE